MSDLSKFLPKKYQKDSGKNQTISAIGPLNIPNHTGNIGDTNLSTATNTGAKQTNKILKNNKKQKNSPQKKKTTLLLILLLFFLVSGGASLILIRHRQDTRQQAFVSDDDPYAYECDINDPSACNGHPEWCHCLGGDACTGTECDSNIGQSCQDWGRSYCTNYQGFGMTCCVEGYVCCSAYDGCCPASTPTNTPTPRPPTTTPTNTPVPTVTTTPPTVTPTPSKTPFPTVTNTPTPTPTNTLTPTSTLTPTPTSTNTPTPTEVPRISCSATGCATDDQCAEGLVCADIGSTGICSLPELTDSCTSDQTYEACCTGYTPAPTATATVVATATPTTTPSSPTATPTPVITQVITTVGCNENCNENADCTNISHICYEGYCRLDVNPTDVNCRLPDGGNVIERAVEVPTESGFADWFNFIKVGFGILGLGALLLLLL
jgi:hypothetical protein